MGLMELYDKLKILADGAKYDAACTSSGVDRSGKGASIGSAVSGGICHSFAADGRCISLLKVLFTNYCIYDCKYCVNRRSNEKAVRAAFTPRELCDLTIGFYRRNYIEGLFLSSGVVGSPDNTCELLIKTLRMLRDEGFGGYIHVKAIPGADPRLIDALGMLADRMSVNIELPSEESLKTLAPDKTKAAILKPMGYLRDRLDENKAELVKYKSAPRFSPGGHATQMIIGATPDTDFKIINLAEGLYGKYKLKRVFYSAYMPVSDNSLLPSVDTKPPLLREHRLYQADWLLRFYKFKASELLDENNQNFNLMLDPKCNWAINNMENFPVEIMRASEELLLRVPGIGPTSCKRILTARRTGKLDYQALKRLGVVLKRAQYFITCDGKLAEGLKITNDGILRALVSNKVLDGIAESQNEQMMFIQEGIMAEDVRRCLKS